MMRLPFFLPFSLRPEPAVLLFCVALAAACSAKLGPTLEPTESKVEPSGEERPKSFTRERAEEPTQKRQGTRRWVPLVDLRSNRLLPTDHKRLFAPWLEAEDPTAKAVPKTVHRVVAPDERGGKWPEHAAWRHHATNFGWRLVEWTPAEVMASLAGCTGDEARMAEAIGQALQRGRSDVAAHLAGLHVLKQEGGLLIGPLVRPPALGGRPIPLEHILGLTGVTLATNLHSRSVGAMSFYLTNALVAVAAGAPWIATMAAGAAANTLYLFAEGHLDWPSRYYAGNTFLSRESVGPINLIPFPYLQQTGVFPAIGDYDEDEDAL